VEEGRSVAGVAAPSIDVTIKETCSPPHNPVQNVSQQAGWELSHPTFLTVVIMMTSMLVSDPGSLMTMLTSMLVRHLGIKYPFLMLFDAGCSTAARQLVSPA
jgi:hypothetical protein